MEMIELNELFEIEYGNQFNFNKMTVANKSGINFISRSSNHLGIVGQVHKNGTEPYDSGLITVSLGGSVLSSFVQPKNFYTAQNIKVLKPRNELSFGEKIFYCKCIQNNKFRYSSHGREANKSLDNLAVPTRENIPDWLVALNEINYLNDDSVLEEELKLSNKTWKWFEYDEIFDVKKGKRLTKADMTEGDTPFIGAIDSNNGYRQFIKRSPIHHGNTITVNYNGSVGEAFYQPQAFWASDDVNVLYPKFKLNKYIGLFLVTVIQLEQYRFNYGRKWNLKRMRKSKIKLPVNDNDEIDTELMESYIKSLPYSIQLSHTS